MLKQCHNKLSFSKQNWYVLALNAIVPQVEKNIVRSHSRHNATLTSLPTILDDKAMPTFVMPTHMEPLQPIKKIKHVLNPSLSIKRKKQVKTGTTVNAGEDIIRRCDGFKRYDGQRCKRMVRTDSLVPESEQVFCYHHELKGKKKSSPSKRKTIVQKTCSHAYRTEEVPDKSTIPPKVYDCWNLWIDKDIKESQRELIRQEMLKPVSSRDQPGFIYVYNLSQGLRASKSDYAYFKIGRTTDPHRRMYQVNYVCKIEPKIIELFPSFPHNNNNLQVLPNNLTTMEDTLDDVPKCPLAHRVERLIHLELSVLFDQDVFYCPECGMHHREWIRVERTKHASGELMTDQEIWLSKIRPVILKWVQYGVIASAIKA